jgi:hypothetical protein
LLEGLLSRVQGSKWRRQNTIPIIQNAPTPMKEVQKKNDEKFRM